MEKFEDVLTQYEPMISAVIRKLNIYRDFEQFRQAGRVALWQAWERFDENKGNFTPFAYRSIYGALLDELKRESRFSDVHTPVEEETLEGLSEVPYERDNDDLHAVIMDLPLEQRQLLIMIFVENRTRAECAQFFGISVAGIKKRRERLLHTMKQQLITEN